MNEELNKLFNYCQIPSMGQEYINKYYKEQALTEFQLNKNRFKYLNFIAFIARFGVDLTKQPYNYLYHYLFKNDLIKILNSQEYYIGNQNDMNDPQESNFAMQRMRVWLNDKNKQFDLIDNQFQNMFYRRPYQTYLWSFTTNRNSQAMQRYGDTVIRVNSGLIYDDLQKSCDEFREGQKDVVPLTPPLLIPIKVCYDNNIINEYTDYLAEIFTESYKKNNQAGMQEVVDYLKFYSMVFKNPLLKEEEEIRFIINRPLFTCKQPYDVMINQKMKLLGHITPENLSSITVNHQTDTWYQGRQTNSISDTIRDLKYVIKDCKFYKTRVNKTQLPY